MAPIDSIVVSSALFNFMYDIAAKEDMFGIEQIKMKLRKSRKIKIKITKNQ
jgi:hypothetical protein